MDAAVYALGDRVVHSDFGICQVVAVKGRLILIRSLAIGHRHRRYWVDLSVDAGKVRLCVGPASKRGKNTRETERTQIKMKFGFKRRCIPKREQKLGLLCRSPWGGVKDEPGNIDYDCSDTDINTDTEDAILASTQRKSRRKTSAVIRLIKTATNVWGSH